MAFQPAGIAVNATNVYWADVAGGIGRVPLSGGSATFLGPTTGQSAIALDAVHVYWDFADVQSAPLAGGSIATLLSIPFGGQSAYASGLAVDTTSLYFLFTNNGQQQLESIPVGGGPPTVLAAGWSFVNAESWPCIVDADDTSVYWAKQSTANGSVMSVPKGGGSQVTLAEGQGGVLCLAHDDTNVYWTNGDGLGGLVMSVPKGGGASVVIASSQVQPSGIVVDATYVYWSNYAWGNVTMGTVMRAAKCGGAPEIMAFGLAQPNMMAQDASALYWTADAAVMKLAK
jgi:hypothetical protein